MNIDNENNENKEEKVNNVSENDNTVKEIENKNVEKESKKENNEKKEKKEKAKKTKKEKVKKPKKEKIKKPKKENKVWRAIKNRIFKDSTLTFLLIVAVIAAYVAINMGIKALDITDIDLTKEKFYSLSEESKNQIKNVDQEIEIYVFGYEENSSVVDLIKQYAKYKENIKYEVVSIETRQDIAQKYDVSSTDESNGTIVIANGDRKVKVSATDLYSYDYNTYETVDLTEQKLTNSILAVTLDNAPKIYFLTGHGEYTLKDYMTTLNTKLKGEVNEVESLDLLVTNEIPSDCQVLAIVSPTTDFTDYETDIITSYINNGGDILWLSDYSTSGTLTNVNKILNMYGIDLANNGIILEQDKSAMLMQTPNLILPNLSSESEITSPIVSGGKVLLFNSGKIDIKSNEKLENLGVDVTKLLTTTNSAIFRTDLSNSSTSPSSGEEAKEYVVGALATKTISNDDESEDAKKSNLVIYANAIFAIDYPIQISNQAAYAIDFYNNQDLILNSISYLTERTDTITIRKTYTSVPYTATASQDIVVRLIIFIVPLVIIAIGIVVWVIRKRRK